jgi:transposase
MPALVTMRHNPDLKVKYQAMIEGGKPAKVALTALMRKLIELANALIKANQTWVKKRLDQHVNLHNSLRLRNSLKWAVF